MTYHKVKLIPIKQLSSFKISALFLPNKYRDARSDRYVLLLSTSVQKKLEALNITPKYLPNWASLIAQLVKNLPAMRRHWFNSWVGKICWRRYRLPTPVFLGFPCGSVGKESACNVGDLGLIPGLERSSGEGKGYPFQYSSLENSMDCIVHGVSKNRTQLNDSLFKTMVSLKVG